MSLKASHSEYVIKVFFFSNGSFIYLLIFFLHALITLVYRLSRSMKFNSMSFDKLFFRLFSCLCHFHFQLTQLDNLIIIFFFQMNSDKWAPLTNLDIHLYIIRLVASKSRRIWCRAPITVFIWNAIHTCGSVTILKQFKCRLQVINWEKKWTDFL